MNFPANFLWGVSTSSYQIEGAADADGKGPSIWDVFCATPGKVFHGHTGAAACDHYHRYRDDIALMKALGIQCYRFSLSWPRILPAGTGAVNPKGVAFYSRLVDELLAAGITPFPTLFHWDLPYELHQRGGWLNPDSPQWFADYTRVVVDALSDRVRHWTTQEEPVTYILLGYQRGEHAPGLQLPLAEVLQAGHHTLLAHGRAVQVIRAHAKQPSLIGCDATGCAHVPVTAAPADIAAARHLSFRAPADDNFWCNSWWGDPVYLGRYPDGARLPRIKPGDLETICQPLDICQLSVYGGRRARARNDGTPEEVPYPPGYANTTQNNWAVEPDCLYWAAKFHHERYRLPVVIAENGFQNIDNVALDGQVHDPQRVDYLRRVLPGLHRAIQEGVPVAGYFHWTLLDNFEWSEGYRQRVGLVHVDFATQQRTPKDSAAVYRDIIATNGGSLGAQ